jgi:hypothetical protein
VEIFPIWPELGPDATNADDVVSHCGHIQFRYLLSLALSFLAYFSLFPLENERYILMLFLIAHGGVEQTTPCRPPLLCLTGLYPRQVSLSTIINHADQLMHQAM